jgi:hypothetical protein
MHLLAKADMLVSASTEQVRNWSVRFLESGRNLGLGILLGLIGLLWKLNSFLSLRLVSH